MNIKEILIDKIKKNGSLNIAEFIQTCQFENDGYYLKNNPLILPIMYCLGLLLK